MKKMYLMRHTITDEHENARTNSVMGFNDVGLNSRGIQAAKDIGEKLRGKNIEGIISSNLKSAMETAQIISWCLEVPVYSVDILKERSHGEFQCENLEQLYANNPHFSITTAGEGRETLRNFMTRTKYGFSRICNDFNWDCCLVISHKGFLLNYSYMQISF